MSKTTVAILVCRVWLLMGSNSKILSPGFFSEEMSPNIENTMCVMIVNVIIHRS